MARLPRLSLPEHVHYVIQRGHNGMRVFGDDADRAAYLQTLQVAATANRLVVHGYALLDDAIHLLATPAEDHSLARAMQSLGRRYVSGFNRRHQRSGTLWEGRYRATVVESPGHFLDALRCVEQAPVRAGLAGAAGDWRWSSAAHHLGRVRDVLVVEAPPFWSLGNTPFERDALYRLLLDEPLTPSLVERITLSALRGWVMGSPEFVAGLERGTERPLAPRRRGRPTTRVAATTSAAFPHAPPASRKAPA